MSGAILVSDYIEATQAAALETAAPGLRRIVLRRERAADLSAVEIAYFSGDLYPERAREFWRPVLRAPALRWLHSYSAGVDDPVFARARARGVRLTTSSGAGGVHIAHSVMAYLLALSRDLPRWLSAQRRRSWEPRTVGDLQDRVLGIVGLGPIGREVARLGAAFGMRVIGVRRTPCGDEPCETWPMERLHDLLAAADAVVLALPLTADTRHLIGADALARLQPHAVIVNVGRGELIDEAALIESLLTRRVGGAALDVFETEPLPRASPLWELPNVIITAHSAGQNPANDERATAIFLENLARYCAGLSLRNEVGV